MNTIINSAIANLIGGLIVLMAWFIITHAVNIHHYITSFWGRPESNLIIKRWYRWRLNHQQRWFVHQLLVRLPIARTYSVVDYYINDAWEEKQLLYLQDNGLISVTKVGEGTQGDAFSLDSVIVYHYRVKPKHELYQTFDLKSYRKLLSRKGKSDEEIERIEFCTKIMGMKYF